MTHAKTAAFCELFSLSRSMHAFSCIDIMGFAATPARVIPSFYYPTFMYNM